MYFLICQVAPKRAILMRIEDVWISCVWLQLFWLFWIPGKAGREPLVLHYVCHFGGGWLCWFVLQFRNSDSDIIQFRSNSELCQYVTNCDKWYGVGKVFQKEWNLLKTFFFSATQFCVKQQQKPSCSQCLGQF